MTLLWSFPRPYLPFCDAPAPEIMYKPVLLSPLYEPCTIHNGLYFFTPVIVQVVLSLSIDDIFLSSPESSSCEGSYVSPVSQGVSNGSGALDSSGYQYLLNDTSTWGSRYTKSSPWTWKAPKDGFLIVIGMAANFLMASIDGKGSEGNDYTWTDSPGYGAGGAHSAITIPVFKGATVKLWERNNSMHGIHIIMWLPFK